MKVKPLFFALALAVVSMLVVAPTYVSAETCNEGNVKVEWNDTLNKYSYECTDDSVTVTETSTNREICWVTAAGYQTDKVVIKYDGLFAVVNNVSNGCWATPSYDISNAVFYSGPTLVEITNFEGSVVNGVPRLTWETGSELDLVGFNVYSAYKPTAIYVKLTPNLILAQTPGSLLGNVYTWNDTSFVKPGWTYYYKLEQVDTAGQTEFYGPVAIYVPPLLVYPGLDPVW